MQIVDIRTYNFRSVVKESHEKRKRNVTNRARAHSLYIQIEHDCWCRDFYSTHFLFRFPLIYFESEDLTTVWYLNDIIIQIDEQLCKIRFFTSRYSLQITMYVVVILFTNSR